MGIPDSGGADWAAADLFDFLKEGAAAEQQRCSQWTCNVPISSPLGHTLKELHKHRQSPEATKRHDKRRLCRHKTPKSHITLKSRDIIGLNWLRTTSLAVQHDELQPFTTRCD